MCIRDRIGGDVNTAVRAEKKLVIVWGLISCHHGQQPAGAQAVLFIQDATHIDASIDQSFHKYLSAAFPDKMCIRDRLGFRGAKTAAYGIDPDYGVAVDVTSVADALGSKHGGSSFLGGGAAIKVMDSSVICHPQMVARLEALAEARGIPVQRDVIRAGGTDAGGIHTSRMGVLTGGISIPCRYIHTPQELADRGDIEAAARLIAAFAEERL